MDVGYALQGRIRATPGRGDELQAILLRAAVELERFPECRLYLVTRPLDEHDEVWVTELWTTEEAHDASLQDESVRALIQEAMPLLAAPPAGTRLEVAGGKGPDLAG